MFYIKQIYGPLYDQAELLKTYVHGGEFEQARRVFVKACGYNPPEDADMDWWLDDAPRWICCQCGNIYDDYPMAREEWASAKNAAAAAGHRLGGTWTVEWEY